jgi:hypothetical protein
MEFTPEWFDLSSRAWLANKKRSGYSYTYKCGLEDCKNNVKGCSLNCKHHEGQGIVLRSIVKAPRSSGVATRSMTRINRKLIVHPN